MLKMQSPTPQAHRWSQSRRHYFLHDLTLCVLCVAALIAIVSGAGWLNDHAAQILLGIVVVLVIVALGCIVGALLAGPRA